MNYYGKIGKTSNFLKILIANFIGLSKIGLFFVDIYFISVEFYFLVELELNIDPVFSKKEIKYLEIIVMIELIAYDAYAF